MARNTAAWLVRSNAPLEADAAPYPQMLAPHQVLVRAEAVAVNPIDWIVRSAGRVMYPWLKGRAILGSDVAGTVVTTGAAVTRFTVGDRVLGLAVGTDKDVNATAQGAFQTHVVLEERLMSPIPEAMSFADASVLPLGVATAASGLFQKKNLALRLPTASPLRTGETVLVWGGSTSVGSNAVQLAVAAGYDVVTTASPRNFSYVRELGAADVFDYRSPTVVQDIAAALHGRDLVGALAIGEGSASCCIDVIRRTNRRHKTVAMASTAISLAPVAAPGASAARLVTTMATMGAATGMLALKGALARVRTPFIWGSSLKNDEVGDAVFRDFLPAALASGRYLPAPSPQVVGHGVGEIENGLRAQLAGVSAAKIVVTL